MSGNLIRARLLSDGRWPPSESRCRCDGRYPDCYHDVPCPLPPGGHISPYFCRACDSRRIEAISASLDEMVGKSEQ